MSRTVRRRLMIWRCCLEPPTAFQSGGYNLIGTMGSGIGFAGTGDQTNDNDPKLESLANNGGDTQPMPFMRTAWRLIMESAAAARRPTSAAWPGRKTTPAMSAPMKKSSRRPTAFQRDADFGDQALRGQLQRRVHRRYQQLCLGLWRCRQQHETNPNHTYTTRVLHRR